MRTIETRPIVSTILIVMTTHECHEPLPIVYIISNYIFIIIILQLCLFVSTYRLFMLIGLIFVIAGTQQNAGRKAATAAGQLALPEVQLTTHRSRGAVGRGVDEGGEGRPPPRAS